MKEPKNHLGKRYKNDTEFRERIKLAVKKYQNTPKGRKSKKDSLMKLREKHPNYHKKYMKARRLNRIKSGLCPRCGKKPITPHFKSCENCREYAKKNSAEHQKIYKP